MKTSVISKEFRDRYLVNPKDPNVRRARDRIRGPEDYHARIDRTALDIDERCVLFVRGTGPIGYPGGAEVVNMQPPAALIKRGIRRYPASAMAGSPQDRARRRSSTPARKLPPTVALRSSRPATGFASTSTKAAPTS